MVNQQLVNAISEHLQKYAPLIQEHVKWNSPAYTYTGPIPEGVTAKEYPRDVLVLNLRQKEGLLLIFPTGTRVSGIHPMLEGNYADGRRMMKILPTSPTSQWQDALDTVIQAWLATVMDT